MSYLKRVRLLCAGTLLGVGSVAAAAQQAPSPPSEKPPMTKPDAAPAPSPAPPQQKPAAKAPSATLVGLSAFSSDGSKVGDVRAVKTAPDGKTMLHVRTGGFLGFGGRIVAVPEGRYTKSGDSIRLNLTAEEVSKLPEVKDES
jgi:hypothetical protein